MPAFVRLLFDSQGPTVHQTVLDLKTSLRPLRWPCQRQAYSNEMLAGIISRNMCQKAGIPSIPLMLNRRWRACYCTEVEMGMVRLNLFLFTQMQTSLVSKRTSRNSDRKRVLHDLRPIRRCTQ